MHKEPSIAALQSGDALVYKQLYEMYRGDFLAFAKAYSTEHDVCAEAFQEGMIGLYENVMRKKVTSFSSSIKTYVFAIGKYKLLERLRKDQKLIPVDSYHFEGADHYEEMSALSERQLKLKQSFKKLGERCQQILELFYLRGYSIKEIKETEGYENENTVKAQKSRCLRQLKTEINA